MDYIKRCGPCWVMLALLWGPALAHAGAFRIFDQSASGTAQSNAVIAQADDPSAVYYNAAGITQLRGVQLSLGTTFIGGSTPYTSPTGETATGTFGNNFAFPPPSNFYLTANLKDLGMTALGDLSLGLALLSPFGTLQDWSTDGPFRFDLTSQALELLDIKPTLAYRFNDHFSIGLGADIYTFAGFWGEAQAETKFRSAGVAFTGFPAETPLEINGDDMAAGFNVSLLYTPLRNDDGKPLVNVGLIYRSQATLHLDGQFLANGGLVADARTTLVLPQIITGGIALWPVRDQDHEWKLEFDLDYTGWKSVRNTDVHLSNGLTIPVDRDWRNSFTPMVGTEYTWLRPERLPGWEVALRAGYFFSQTPIPDRTFSPGVPDTDYHAISLGVGLLCKTGGTILGLIQCGEIKVHPLKPKAIGLDLAFQTLIFETRTVSGSQPPLAPAGLVDGTYETTFYIGALNLRLYF